MKKFTIRDYVLVVFIGLVVQLIWSLLELVFYGEIQPRLVDDIIGIILITSLFLNVKQNSK